MHRNVKSPNVQQKNPINPHAQMLSRGEMTPPLATKMGKNTDPPSEMLSRGVKVTPPLAEKPGPMYAHQCHHHVVVIYIKYFIFFSRFFLVLQYTEYSR